jgi:transposase
MQFVTKAVDEVRRRETKEYTFLKGSRYLWLKNPETLTEQQTLLLEDLKTKNQSLFMAYQMKENVKDFFKQTSREDAEQFLQTWCTWIDSSNIEPMKQVVKTIKSHWNGLLNYAETCINSGITEGVNSIIQTLKRRARGYSNFSNFKTMIYLKI